MFKTQLATSSTFDAVNILILILFLLKEVILPFFVVDILITFESHLRKKINKMHFINKFVQLDCDRTMYYSGNGPVTSAKYIWVGGRTKQLSSSSTGL